MVAVKNSDGGSERYPAMNWFRVSTTGNLLLLNSASDEDCKAKATIAAGFWVSAQVVEDPNA